MKRWGNQFYFKERASVSLKSPESKLAIGFNLSSRKPEVVRVYLYVENFSGTPLNFSLQVRPEAAGNPAEEVICESRFEVKESGFVAVDVNCQLERNGHYYLVIFSEEANPERFANFAYLKDANLPVNKILLAQQKERWQLLRGAEAIYLLEFSDGTFFGQTYLSKFTSAPIYGQSSVGEVFTLPEPQTVTQVAFRLRKSSPLRPQGDLIIALQDVRTGEVLEEGVILKAARASSQYKEIRYTFKTPHTLKINSRLRIILKAPQATEECFYQAEGLDSSLEEKEKFLFGTFLKNEAGYCQTEPTELTGWREDSYRDLYFWFGVTPFPIVARPIEEATSRRRKILLTIIILLLLLQFFGLFYYSFYRVTPEIAEFLKKNRQCLICHVEMIPKLYQPVVHNPFLKKRCLDCHLDHAQRVYRETIRTYKEARGKVGLRTVCGKWFGIKPESPCGKMIGIAPKKITKEKEVLKKKVTKRYESIGPAGLIMPLKPLCFSCHPELAPRDKMHYRHYPFHKGQCTSCHNPHASDYLSLLATDEKYLCVSCHPMRSEFALPVMHPPFDERACLSCHQPHASEYIGILADSQKVVCLACHPPIAKEYRRPVRHQPFDRYSCTLCHRPHSSRVSVLLQSQLPYLCYNCHPALRLEFLRISHHPVNVTWTCLKCHAPHSADYPKLCIAKDNELCFKCHGDRITPYSNKYYYLRSAHNQAVRVGKGLCLNCHVPHGSDYPPLEVIPETALCYLCHNRKVFSRRATIKTHPVEKPYRDERIGWDLDTYYVNLGGREGKVTFVVNPDKRAKTLLCTTSCHDPHGTAYPQMVIWKPDKLCLNCHQIYELP